MNLSFKKDAYIPFHVEVDPYKAAVGMGNEAVMGRVANVHDSPLGDSNGQRDEQNYDD